MITVAQQEFLEQCFLAAVRAEHVFPEMAACEAALESRWGTSELALRAHNVFGTKQRLHPEYGTIHLPTKEFLHQQWVTVWSTDPRRADKVVEIYKAHADALRLEGK